MAIIEARMFPHITSAVRTGMGEGGSRNAVNFGQRRGVQILNIYGYTVLVSLGTSKGTSIVIELGIGNLAGLFWNLHNK